MLRRDDAPTDGRASVLFGAVGKFWSPTHNAPVTVTPDEFLAFDRPGYAKAVTRLEANAVEGATRVVTETGVVGTDPVSTKLFAPYWMLIRLPSGLIRRSWLAAIHRRVRH